MRDKILGRWMVRWAVALGVGALVLGLPMAARADDLFHRDVVITPTQKLTPVGDVQPSASPSPSDSVYVTEDWSWN
jgi:hypothetical protein